MEQVQTPNAEETMMDLVPMTTTEAHKAAAAASVLMAVCWRLLDRFEAEDPGAGCDSLTEARAAREEWEAYHAGDEEALRAAIALATAAGL